MWCPHTWPPRRHGAAPARPVMPQDWKRSRSLIADAIDRDGTFLDVGCANGYPDGVAPADGRRTTLSRTASTSRRSSSRWRVSDCHGGPIGSGSGTPGRGSHRGGSPTSGPALSTRLPIAGGHLVEHLLSWCDRLIVGVFNEQAGEHATEQMLRDSGLAITGSTERDHTEPSMRYRCSVDRLPDLVQPRIAATTRSAQPTRNRTPPIGVMAPSLRRSVSAKRVQAAAEDDDAGNEAPPGGCGGTARPPDRDEPGRDRRERVPQLVVGRGLPVVEPFRRHAFADRVRTERARGDPEESEQRACADERSAH